jgi:murein DD-endopeptidase MepM/ murein hydrolase activator NlpD
MTMTVRKARKARLALTGALPAVVVAALLGGSRNIAAAEWNGDIEMRGYDITPSGLKLRYPHGFECSPLTSLYASWIDVDGTRRAEIHSGVDGGRLGDWILAPGPGTVRAAWQADWGWGSEGALLISHTSQELNLTEDIPVYYSEFDHLSVDEIRHFEVGESIVRGQKLARVFRPGGNEEYLPEVHWEVWAISKEDELSWSTNKVGGKYWINESARLIDPLYMLARNTPPDSEGGVVVTPFVANNDYRDFHGFTYILPCQVRSIKKYREKREKMRE